MSKRQHPFPANLPRKGVALPVRAAGTRQTCEPAIPGKVCPEYTAYLRATETHCRLSWLPIPFPPKCTGRAEDLHHEPCGIGKDDRSQGGICRPHHAWRTAAPPRHPFPIDAQREMERVFARMFRGWLDQIGGGR